MDGDIIPVCKCALMAVEFVSDGEVLRSNFEDFFNSGAEMFSKP